MVITGANARATTGMAERGDVLETLERLLDYASEGRGGALFVSASAGLGKTTVLEYAITMAKPRFAVGVGRGDRVEAVLPFGLVGHALHQLRDGSKLCGGGVALDGDGAEGGDISPQARFYGILREVREAASSPVLLAIDDLHWSDPDSLIAINLICRRLASLPVALIATVRPWPVQAYGSAQDLAAQGLAQVMSLAPLSPTTVREILHARVSDSIPTMVVDQAVTMCGGNPLLVEQAAIELSRSGKLTQGHVWLPRFLGVGAAGQRYLQAASVLGTRFRADVATKVAGLSVSEAGAEIEGLFRGGLLFEADDGWARFTHALIRQGVYADIAPPLRRNLHAASFRTLVAAGAYPAEAAEHAVAAHLTGDPQAVATVARAGRAALRVGAVRAACQHLADGMRLAGQAAPPELSFDFAAALAAGGVTGEAIAVYERLSGSPDLPMADRIAALRELGQASFFMGHVERAAGCFESAVGLAEQDHPALAVGALLDQSFHHQALFGPRAALPWVNRAAELATARGVMQSSAQAAWGAIAYRCGDPHGLTVAARAAMSPVDPVATSLSMQRHRYWDPTLSYAAVAVHAERFADAERLLSDIVSSAQRRCEPLTLLRAAMAWIECLCRLGRLHEAVAALEHLIELAELFPYGDPIALTYRAMVFVELGKLDRAAVCCAQLPTTLHQDGYSLHRIDGMQLHIRAVLAYRQGDANTACSLFAALQEWADRTGEADPSFVPWAGDAVATYLACGRDTDARRVIDWVAERAVALPTQWPKIVVTTGQAALAERTGDRARADSYFMQALEHHDQLPMPLARSTTLTDYGAFVRRGGDRARARTLLDAALHIAENCAAGWHAGRARAEWQRAGGRSRMREPMKS